MYLKLNTTSGVPIYLQIIQQIKELIITGALKPGEQLLSVRELSTQLRINPNTVARSYRELKYEKVIESRWGEGNYVAEDIEEISLKEKEKIAGEELELVIAKARKLGLSDENISRLFSDIIAK